jgi:hypothetical protein
VADCGGVFGCFGKYEPSGGLFALHENTAALAEGEGSGIGTVLPGAPLFAGTPASHRPDRISTQCDKNHCIMAAACDPPLVGDAGGVPNSVQLKVDTTCSTVRSF